jgi:hypothetical protein
VRADTDPDVPRRAVPVPPPLPLALVLAACAAAAPVEPFNDAAPPPEGVDAAVALARRQWSDRLGIELPDPPEVRWYRGCLVYRPEDSRPEWAAVCIAGRYLSASDEVHLKDVNGTVAGSSLAHELLHWALEVERGDSDPGHRSRHWAEVCAVRALIAARDPSVVGCATR